MNNLNLNQRKNRKLFKKPFNSKSKYFYIFLPLLFLCFISIPIFSNFSSNVYANNLADIEQTHPIITKEHIINLSEKNQLPNYQDSIDSLQQELIVSVDNYMRKYYPNTKLSAEHIVNQCIEHDFDIPLLLSQARQESCFGKKTRGNSVFGVVSRKYSHVNNSVTDYIQIMKKSYVNKRTPEQCLASGFYVEGSKKYKYAASTSYAKTIANIRTNIIKTTLIQELHDQIRNFQDEVDSIKNSQHRILQDYKSTQFDTTKLLC